MNIRFIPALRLVQISFMIGWVACAAEPGVWTAHGPSGGAQGGATVYAASRGQVLRWGGMGGGNEVRAFDAATGAWSEDYPSDGAHHGGNFYGGQEWAGWYEKSGRPQTFYLFRLGCWDSKRHRFVIGAQNLTAAYDPATRTWTDLKAALLLRDGTRKPGTAPQKFEGDWFAPVPGQWGSMCYDAHNDEILLFPLMLTRRSRSWRYPMDLVRDAQPVDAGVRAGHFGTMVFDPNENLWKYLDVGPQELRAARASLAELIDLQREATRDGYQGLIHARQGSAADAAASLKRAAASQAQVLERLRAFRANLEDLGQSLSDPFNARPRAAVTALDGVLARLDAAHKEMAAGDAAALPALCSQQRAGYRELRRLRDRDLYVEPTPCASAGVVYDAKNKLVVMAGGTHLDRVLNETWVYDCASRTWHRRAPAPEALEWPGMCYDSKRGRVVYVTPKASYAYDAAADRWSKIGGPTPKDAWPGWHPYTDMAYDEKADLYVLNIGQGKNGKTERTLTMKPAEQGTPVTTEAMPEPPIDEAPFPPAAHPEVLANLKALPANTWTDAGVPHETVGRSWSTMTWDAALQCVVYLGGGHAGTMSNTISLYFPKANLWVDSHPSQNPPHLYGNWQCSGHIPTYERGLGLSLHARGYGSYAGVHVYGAYSGFEWATREIPVQPDHRVVAFNRRPPKGTWCLHPSKPLLATLVSGSRGKPFDTLHLSNLISGETAVHKLQGPAPTVGWEWDGVAIHPDRNVLVLHGAGQEKKTANETWTLNLDQPNAWKKLETGDGAPLCEPAKLNAIGGTALVTLAAPAYENLWVLDLDKSTWRELPTQIKSKASLNARQRRFELYGQCVWCPGAGVFVRKGDYGFPTLLLRPDFSVIAW